MNQDISQMKVAGTNWVSYDLEQWLLSFHWTSQQPGQVLSPDAQAAIQTN